MQPRDFISRMKQGCKMLIIGTRWSIHDPIGRLKQLYEDDKKSKFVKIPALDLNGESNFNYDYKVGFSTDYFKSLKENMDDISLIRMDATIPLKLPSSPYTQELQFRCTTRRLLVM